MAVTDIEIEAAPRCPECGSPLVFIRSNLIACPEGLENTKLIPIDKQAVASFKRVQRMAELPIATKVKKKSAVYSLGGKLYGRAVIHCRHWPGEVLARTETKSGWVCIRLVPFDIELSSPYCKQKSIL